MKCAQCQTVLDDSARFCGVCGARLNALDAKKSDPAKVVVGPQAFRPETPAPLPPPPKVVPPPATASSPSHSSLATAKTMMGKPPVVKDPFVGILLNNRYQIESKIGQGGFGAVYKAKQVAANREVAL